MYARQWSLLVAAVTVLAAPGIWMALRANPVAAPPVPSSAPADAPAVDTAPLVGTAGCSARGCHGRIGPGPDPAVRQNEFSLWLEQDRHAQAYQALRGDLAGAIVRGVYGPNHTASTEPACLACHTNPHAAAGGSALLNEEQRQGVGCEACHGGAERWLPLHTTDEWKHYTPEVKATYGMAPVGDQAALAETCVGCHIGAPADQARGLPVRDMNHDMIAAGHPRLAFEFGAFRANLPPHWDEAAKKRPADFEANVWAVGQVVSAQAALKLLADRAGDDKRPWPEFAEYDCSACHHDLEDPSWRQKRGYDDRPPGSLPWGGWYAAMPRRLDPSLAGDFDGMARAMATPLKDRKLLPQQALALAGKLHPAPLSPDEVRKLRASLGRPTPGDPDPDWETAEQLYLAAAALSQAHGDGNAEKLLNDLSEKLARPREFGWPEGYRPDLFLKDFQGALK